MGQSEHAARHICKSVVGRKLLPTIGILFFYYSARYWKCIHLFLTQPKNEETRALWSLSTPIDRLLSLVAVCRACLDGKVWRWQPASKVEQQLMRAHHHCD